MHKYLGFLPFIAVFLALYGALNYYVLFRLTGMFGMPRSRSFYAVFIGLTLSYAVANTLERQYNSPISLALYTLASSWMGVVFILFVMLLLYEITRLLTDIPPIVAGFIVVGVGLVLFVYSLWNARNVSVKNIEIESSNISKESVIVQWSDVHLGTIQGRRYLSKLVEVTNALKPDLVLITGDLIDGPRERSAEGLEPFKQLKAPVFFSMGNHERYVGPETVTELLKNTPIRILRNESVKIDQFRLIGIDDSESAAQVKDHFPAYTDEKDVFSILLYHRPIGYEDAANRKVDLMLTGHLHAGQIFPFILINRLFFHYTLGLYKYKDLYLYVSPGTGTWGPPMRLGSKNEITRFHLVRK